MFNLIISVIAIGLTVALAAATAFYGGSLFTNSNERVVATKYISEAQQLKGALDLYATEHSGEYPAALNDLVTTKYLKSADILETVQNNAQWTTVTDAAIRIVAEENVCNSINEQLGLKSGVFASGVPACADVPAGTGAHCCDDPNT